MLFRFAIAFLKKAEDEILQQRDSLHLNKFLRTIGENMSNVKRISWVCTAAYVVYPPENRFYQLRSWRLVTLVCEIDGILLLNPYLMNGFSHHYHLGESTFIFR